MPQSPYATCSVLNLSHQVEIRVGPGLELLSQLETAGEPPFDMVFIDADKESYAKYLRNPCR